MNRLKTNAEFP